MSDPNPAQLLKELSIALGLGKPPDTITTPELFGKFKERIEFREKQVGGQNKLLDDPLLVGILSPKQWEELEGLHQRMQQEYELRRQMLLKRIEVTVDSFTWSDRLKSKAGEINKIYESRKAVLHPTPKVALSDVIAARADLIRIEKTSSASVRKNTKSDVNAFVIGRVPDRGGRTDEIEPPPPEMPSWQQRTGAPAGSTGWAPRGGGGGRGGYQDNRGGGGGYQNNNRGGYNQDNRGGGYQNQDYRGGSGHQGSRGGRGRDYDQHDYRGGRGNYHEQGDYGVTYGRNNNNASYNQEISGIDSHKGPYLSEHPNEQPRRGSSQGRGRGRVQGGWQR